MHCASCELLLERKFRSLPGVRSVRVNRKKGRATLFLHDGASVDLVTLEKIVMDAGYRFLGMSSEELEQIQHAEQHASRSSEQPRWLEIGGAFLVIFAVYKLLQTFDIVSLAPSTAGALTFGGVFLIGIVAGMSSCLAVTGGLLLAMAAKYHEVHPSDNAWEKMKPLLQFNAGRLISYFVLGGVVGLIGTSVSLSVQTTAYMNIVIALVMLYLALTILHVIPKGLVPVRPPRALSHWIADLSENKHPLAPFALGALTFFLPCGFTQSLQLVALASGSFINGALVMGVFALGTLPALIGISVISSNAKGAFSRLFLTFSGSLVLLLALFNLRSGLALAGYEVPFSLPPQVAAPVQPNPGNQVPPTPTPDAPPPTPSPVAGDVQEVAMAVTPYSYEPSELTIRAGATVRWIVDGSRASGCTRGIVVPSLGIQKILQPGQNIIEFTAPSTPGRLPFSCSMGMVRGSFNVI